MTLDGFVHGLISRCERELNRGSVLSRTTSSENDDFQDTPVLADSEQVVSGNLALEMALRSLSGTHFISTGGLGFIGCDANEVPTCGIQPGWQPASFP